MALKKNQAYAVYLLLTSDSELVRNLKKARANTADDFLTNLGNEIRPLDSNAAANLDPELKNLFSGRTAAGGTNVDQRSGAVLSSLPVLFGIYGDGPCPKAKEQGLLWNAIQGIVFPVYEIAAS